MAARAAASRLEEESAAAVVRWNRLIAGGARRDPPAALPLYRGMLAAGSRPNHHTFPSLLIAAAALRHPLLPLLLHAHLLRLGLLHRHRHSTAALLHLYGKSSLPELAARLFHEIPRHCLDPFHWTALVTSFSANGLLPQAFQAFSRMRNSGDGDGDAGAAPIAALVSSSGKLRHGQMLHALAIKQGLDGNVRMANTFVHMYARCGGAAAAGDCFRSIPPAMRDVVSWNTVISGLTMNGENSSALAVFEEMLAAGEPPNRVTVVSVLKTAAQLGCRETSRQLRRYVLSRRPPAAAEDDVVVMTALVDMQARCGDVEMARETFDGIAGKNVVSWSAMIAGYEQASLPEEALSLFKLMMAEGGVNPNDVTFLSVISAAAAVGATRLAAAIHKLVASAGAGEDAGVFSALVDMYAKCGELLLARRLFAERDLSKMSYTSWTAMIGAEGIHGGGREALSLFQQMQEQGFRPNDVTFVNLISACGHAGLVEEGISCFEAMERDHGVSPNQKHYSCAVDLLGRAGRLQEAFELVEKMPMEADPPVWGSLLGACRIHGNTRLAKLVEGRILGSPNPWSSAGHLVLLANLYNRGGRREDAIRVRVGLKKSHLRKVPGRSFVAVGNAVYGFTAEDRSHEESELIYEELRALDIRVRARKPPPNQASSEEMVADGGEFHSERLAIAFGILMSRRGGGCAVSGGAEPMRITKNLRVCEDCHDWTKSVSVVIGRELVVRDSRRFHHFKNGLCSCGDYW
ncbi:unnamed protein product [Spirodela intermedia]|uniref:DYW domain-containing protein n=1 Tax=Spirodela intermedia TaxID=51605 RepID=A0A7I8KB16_SPIIN|nr:unnamed protein product [Spirodela intermedia]